MSDDAFSRSAMVYDAIYSSKNYEEEAGRARLLADPELVGTSWLEVASGTGRHLPFLLPHYERLVGIDLAPAMVEIAKERVPDADLRVGDMVSFEVNETFDVVSCLFGSIGYCATIERLQSAIACMARHLKPGGRLLIEPWIFGHQFVAGTSHARFVEIPELKVVRMNTNQIEDGRAILEFHHLVADATGVEHYVENHILGLFEQTDYRSAFEHAGLQFKAVVGRTGPLMFVGENATVERSAAATSALQLQGT